MAMDTIDAAVDALRQNLRDTEDEITAKQTDLTALRDNITNNLRPEAEAARKAFRDAPHGTNDQRHERSALKDESDDARATLETANSQLIGLESQINELKTRKNAITGQIASALAEQSRVSGAPPPPADTPPPDSFSMKYDEKSWKLYVGTKTAQQQAISTEWKKEAAPMESILSIVAFVESPFRTLPLEYSSWYSFRHEQPIGADRQPAALDLHMAAFIADYIEHADNVHWRRMNDDTNAILCNAVSSLEYCHR